VCSKLFLLVSIWGCAIHVSELCELCFISFSFNIDNSMLIDVIYLVLGGTILSDRSAVAVLFNMHI
jgi:hypothetical protein